MQAGRLGRLQGVSFQTVSAGLPPSPHPGAQLMLSRVGAETWRWSLVVSV